MAKKKNPQDATLRNVRATKTREATAAKQFDRLEILVGKIRIVQGNHEARLRRLESGGVGGFKAKGKAT